MTKFHAAAVASLSILSALTNLASAQTIRYVRAAAPAGGNGLSWSTAFNTLQPALSAAVAGDEIWVAAGTYTSTAEPYAFTLPTQVSMYGGFSGTETLLNQRQLDSFGSVLSGTSGKTVLRFASVQGAVVDGFKIVNGWGAGDFSTSPSPTGFFHPGGGAQIDASNVVIANCWFDGNRAGWAGFSTPAETGEAGAAFVRNSTARFENCLFTANLGAPHTTPECRAGSPTVYMGPGGGGAVSCKASTVTFIACSFRGNAAGSGWDAFRCNSGLDRTPGAGADGGALLSVNCNLTIDRCAFSQNTSGACGSKNNGSWCATQDANPGRGGAIRLSGGSAVISNSLFVANAVPMRAADICTVSRGGFGGAIYSSSSLHLTNCTFVANSAAGSVGGVGGAVSGSVSNISNCILWDNLDGTESPLSAQLGTSAATVLVSRSIVQGISPGSGNSNLNANPLFLNPVGPDNILGTADDRFDLAITSPAIDAGNNSFYTGSALDLAGNTRFFEITTTPDTGSGTAPIIDIGPYERSRCPADLDDGSNTGAQDNAVTIDDLLYFLVAFESGTAAADLDNGNATGVLDNAVTIDDLLFFLTRFEIGC